MNVAPSCLPVTVGELQSKHSSGLSLGSGHLSLRFTPLRLAVSVAAPVQIFRVT